MVRVILMTGLWVKMANMNHKVLRSNSSLSEPLLHLYPVECSYFNKKYDLGCCCA